MINNKFKKFLIFAAIVSNAFLLVFQGFIRDRAAYSALDFIRNDYSDL